MVGEGFYYCIGITGETWLKVVRRDPVLVDGKLRLYHLLAPSLDWDLEPLCAKVCMAPALHVGPLDELVPLLGTMNAMLIAQKK